MEKIDNVLNYFYEISKIPRKSGKEEKIADYIEEFAKNRNLKYIRDKYNNIIITKEASATCKTKEPIILQCHMDMVCEKITESNHNFETEGIEVYIEDDYLKAKDTTLGADNGIGVAIILAILDSNEIVHPKIEAIFTVQEETTMDGAKNIDVSSITATKMICLDNMRENELLIGCASAKVFNYEISYAKKEVNNDYELLKISFEGFLGGHSGNDISKKRGNPIKEIGNLLSKLNKKFEIFIKNINGGSKVNVIPRESFVEIFINKEDFEKIENEVNNYKDYLLNSYKEENDINVNIEKINFNNKECLDESSTNNIIEIIKLFPNGVYYEDEFGNPLVSLNMGVINTDSEKIHLLFSIRSNKESKEKELLEGLEYLEDKYKINHSITKLPGYEHKDKSLFIEKCKKIYEDNFDQKTIFINMHICLEAGFFGEKIPNLDFIAISPDIFDAHSPNERCSISSLKRIYEYLIMILRQF